MQQAPIRLSQTIQSAFRAAKPVCQTAPSRFLSSRPQLPAQSSAWPQHRTWLVIQTRCYSDSKSEVDKKVEDAKSRIDQAIESRVDVASQPEVELKDPKHETIVHTIPESSSIVHTSLQDHSRHGQSTPSSSSKPEFSSDPLPSQSTSQYSNLRHHFTHFMDNFQSHLFIASKRLNDLTGYSGIEALKKQIEDQESQVQSSRRGVKDARAAYAEAIATRSTTQREVNDLLHRKHTWSPSDLERFTNLYRSDHANEQAEAAAQRNVSDAETKYEEASTKLARTILARYHEEQIWSDKIRQMSTWGTWGLMGLNVLLFVIFQIAVEPWRRRRLVKGFEEKVELALKEQNINVNLLQPNTTTVLAQAALEQATTNEPVTPQPPAEMNATEKVETVADTIVEQIVDAVSGSTDLNLSSSSSTSTNLSSQAPSQPELESTIEEITTAELLAEAEPNKSVLDSTYATFSSTYATYDQSFRELFSDSKHVVLSQRELTGKVIEGAVGGAMGMAVLMMIFRTR